MFTLSGSDDTVFDALFLTPGATARVEGAVLEDLQLLRDEMANLTWAVDQVPWP